MNKQLISELQNNPKMLYYIVNEAFSIKELMGESHNKGIYCPFHGESRASGSKPSARFYDNQVPIKLWCFSEHKSYYAYHYIKLIMKRDPLQYLIKNTSEKKIQYLKSRFELEFDQEENEPLYTITSLESISDLYFTLYATEDHSKWYIV